MVVFWTRMYTLEGLLQSEFKFLEEGGNASLQTLRKIFIGAGYVSGFRHTHEAKLETRMAIQALPQDSRV